LYFFHFRKRQLLRPEPESLFRFKAFPTACLLAWWPTTAGRQPVRYFPPLNSTLPTFSLKRFYGTVSLLKMGSLGKAG
jgi:hypothetical protein